MDRSTKEPRRAVRAGRGPRPHVQTLFAVDVHGEADHEAAHLPAFVRFHQAWVAGVGGALLGVASGLAVGVGADLSGVGSAALSGSTTELVPPSTSGGGRGAASSAPVSCTTPSSCGTCDPYERVGIPHFGG